jgi:hypothetical protein
MPTRPYVNRDTVLRALTLSKREMPAAPTPNIVTTTDSSKSWTARASSTRCSANVEEASEGYPPCSRREVSNRSMEKLKHERLGGFSYRLFQPEPDPPVTGPVASRLELEG